jgi:hypothetical protein
VTPPPDRTTLLLDVPEADHVLESAGRLCLPGATVLRPAHVTLAHPWLPPAEALAATGRLDALLAGRDPLPVRFERVARFGPDRRGRSTIHLLLGEEAGVVELARALGLPLPLPHLSVVRLPAHEPSLRRAEEAVARLLPVDAVARTAQLRIRYGSWWRVEHVAHLGDPPGTPWTRSQPP